jgi:hypothetical protein
VLDITLKSLEGGPEMTASAATERRELAHRSTNGIDVTLLWLKSSNVVTIAVIDSHSGEELEFEVGGRFALDAFNHPYAYAATSRVRSARATRLAPAR